VRGPLCVNGEVFEQEDMGLSEDGRQMFLIKECKHDSCHDIRDRVAVCAECMHEAEQEHLLIEEIEQSFGDQQE
jgi:hypothetical protein